MQSNIQFKIKKKKQVYILYLYNFKLKTYYILEFKNIFKIKLFKLKFIILFLIKFGLINVYL